MDSIAIPPNGLNKNRLFILLLLNMVVAAPTIPRALSYPLSSVSRMASDRIDNPANYIWGLIERRTIQKK
jgi:hypothetical protein